MASTSPGARQLRRNAERAVEGSWHTSLSGSGPTQVAGSSRRTTAEPFSSQRRSWQRRHSPGSSTPRLTKKPSRLNARISAVVSGAAATASAVAAIRHSSGRVAASAAWRLAARVAVAMCVCESAFIDCQFTLVECNPVQL
eukprot:COSAG01_NODE_255_length_20171_cov_8.232164_15_plen_141_part_00